MRRVVLGLIPILMAAQVPRTWTDAAVAELEVPLANPASSPVHISEEAYYKIPERTLHKTYPVYHPDREPAGYQQWLKEQEPQVVFAPGETPSDWVRAGEIVFNAPTSFGPVFFSAEDVRDRKFYEETGMPVAADGTIPFANWVVRKKGQVELGSMGCNTCHTRVLSDGTTVPGAQGNNPGDRQGARMLRLGARFAGEDKILERIRGFAAQFEMPWLASDPNRRARSMPLDALIAAGEAIPPGVTARSNTSMFVPPQVPDLIGVQDRRFLDHTGLVRHRGIADLMRYSTLVQDVMGFARYGDLPPRATGPGIRYSDAQLYALAIYVYSLRPPPNPHRETEQTARGREVFEREKCHVCHAPPFYTNNRLIPAPGFRPPAKHKSLYGVMDRRVDTDPRYTLETRKGTGYYKVPSLKGVWYRGPFGHNGWVMTLEEWFDPARLRDGYVASGFRTGGRVPGHEYGLKLPPGDKSALLAFLRTL
ncbi:MAG: hypothetical protein IPM24_06450 [Bryobacterales bacterium]|nr:hypothetical protein [Bryobacterales bacterium]